MVQTPAQSWSTRIDAKCINDFWITLHWVIWNIILCLNQMRWWRGMGSNQSQNGIRTTQREWGHLWVFIPIKTFSTFLNQGIPAAKEWRSLLWCYQTLSAMGNKDTLTVAPWLLLYNCNWLHLTSQDLWMNDGCVFMQSVSVKKWG